MHDSPNSTNTGAHVMIKYRVGTTYTSSPFDNFYSALKWYNIHKAEMLAGDPLVKDIELIRFDWDAKGEATVKRIRYESQDREHTS